MTLKMYIACFAWGLMVLGLLRRHNRAIHVPLMLMSILMDFLLVLYIQFTADAIQQAVSLTLEVMHMIHIVFSSIAVLLYVPVVYYGFRLLRGDNVRRIHVPIALVAFFCRTVGFAFMFSLLA